MTFHFSSSMLLSTISLTLLSYSLLFSLYIWAAMLLAGESGFGSDNSDLTEVRIAHTSYTGLHWFCNTIIKKSLTVQTDSAVFINVRVEHLRLKHYIRSLVWVLFSELQVQLEQSALPWSSFNALDESLPL